MKMTQFERILRHMELFGGITAAEAMSEYGVYRLAARIADLRAQGYDIISRTGSGKNRFDETTHFAVYSLNDMKERGRNGV